MSGPLRLINRAMAAVYGTSLGARAIGRIFGMPDKESMEAFVATAKATDRSAIKAIVAEVSSGPLPDRLEAISVPVLAVVGEKDTQLARDAVPLLVATIPGARGAQVPGVGHQWNAEASELFAEMVGAWIDHADIHPDLIELSADS